MFYDIFICIFKECHRTILKEQSSAPYFHNGNRSIEDQRIGYGGGKNIKENTLLLDGVKGEGG